MTLFSILVQGNYFIKIKKIILRNYNALTANKRY